MATYNGQFQDASSNVLLATPHSYANIEGSKASQAYTKGQMLVYNNRLCEVTAAIASGNTLTIGTNIAYKNVGDIGKQLVANDGTGFYFDVLNGEYGYYPNASKTASQFVPFGGASADFVLTGDGTYINLMDLKGSKCYRLSSGITSKTTSGVTVTRSGASSVKLSSACTTYKWVNTQDAAPTVTNVAANTAITLSTTPLTLTLQ